MTKSSKAKKAKKADFSKVKIKVGIKLKKAQNETRVDFKVRKIIVKEQLGDKSSSGKLMTKKKHTIKELLSRLGHQSAYVRQDGINGLKELLQDHTEAMRPHLSVLLPRLAFCILDLDSKIRSSTIKIIEILIFKMKEDVGTYYEILVTHLACAMVHMNIGVQSDSLLLMKVLMTHTPSLIARYADTLLSNFINLISRKVSNEQNKIQDFTRTLLVNPTNKLTSLKWRLQLLNELARYLQTILKEKTKEEVHSTKSLWERVVSGCQVSENCGISQIDQLSILSNQKEFKNFTSDIVPLLYQTWAEIDPRRGEKRGAINISDNALNSEGVETLQNILEILVQLHYISLHRNSDQPEKLKMFVEIVSSNFQTDILPGFPFCSHKNTKESKKIGPNSKRMKKSTDSADLLECWDLNVIIIKLNMIMSSCKETKSNPADEYLIHFITKMLNEEINDGKYSMSRLVEVIIQLINLTPSTEFKSVETIISSCFMCYERLHPMKKDKDMLLNILKEITDLKHISFWRCKPIKSWCESLVANIAQDDFDISMYTWQVVALLRQRNTADINSKFISGTNLVIGSTAKN